MEKMKKCPICRLVDAHKMDCPNNKDKGLTVYGILESFGKRDNSL